MGMDNDGCATHSDTASPIERLPVTFSSPVRYREARRHANEQVGEKRAEKSVVVVEGAGKDPSLL